MANSIETKKRRVERKYSKLIDATITDMKDKSMGELWEELDKLKSQMKEDLERIGVVFENP